MSEEKRLIRTIKLQNLLSFGPKTEEIELKSLNVLIGPNASGKSNLIDAIGLLRATPKDLLLAVRAGGGIMDWLWKGGVQTPTAEIDATIYDPNGMMPLRHKISFTQVGQRFDLIDETIENERPSYGHENEEPIFFYKYQNGRPVLSVSPINEKRKLRREDLEINQSVLAQRKDPDQYPEITYLVNQYSKIKLYREWNVGRDTPPRSPQKTDLAEDFLEENAQNLGLVLNDLEHQRGVRNIILEKLKQFHEQFDDISTKIHLGNVQIFLHENGLQQPIPATRLSDGTLRYLCLLSILCHPSPPPLICIEEPELGLHPDILPTIADLLKEASSKTQLIVTTHSDVLVDALTDVPDSVLICEKREGSTTMRRLDGHELDKWLEKYSLGELWLKGELGGTRW